MAVTTNDFTDVQARSEDFVSTFATSWAALREIMGVTRPIKKTPGTVLRAYTASVDLESGAVGKGEKIPISKTTVTEVRKEDLTIQKYGKATYLEDVDKYGAEVAVEMTDEAFRNELLYKILGEFYAFALTGTLNPSGASDFQMGIALAVGSVKSKFKSMRKDASKVTVFVNTDDAYKYLGAAQLTVQNAFGLEYVKNFLGAETLILAAPEDVPAGKIIAIPQSNIVDYYADPSDSAYAKMGLRYTVDPEAPMLGFAVEGDYSTATGKDIWWVGDFSDVNEDKESNQKAGYLAIHLMNALNTNGFNVSSANKDKADIPFEYLGHYSIKTPDVIPYEVYLRQGVEGE